MMDFHIPKVWLLSLCFTWSLQSSIILLFLKSDTTYTVHTKFLKILFSTLLYFEKIKFFQRLEMNFFCPALAKKEEKNLFVIYTNSNSIIMSNSISKHKCFIFCNLVESLAMQNLKYVTIESTLIEIEICIILMNWFDSGLIISLWNQFSASLQ